MATYPGFQSVTTIGTKEELDNLSRLLFKELDDSFCGIDLNDEFELEVISIATEKLKECLYHGG